MNSILDFTKKKINKEKISMITAYDYSSAKAVADSEIDCILVGDSLAMVIYGYESTVNATIEMMLRHTEAVKRAAPNKFIIGDMPFLTYRKNLEYCMDCASSLMQAGASAIKLEGVDGHESFIKHLVQSGIPVMGHLGLTPQSVHQLGGYKVQGKNDENKKIILEQAKKLQDLGCFSLVLECVPEVLAETITNELSIACIGIGAGVNVDGQVLVMQDLIGLNIDFKPKFVRNYSNQYQQMKESFNNYHKDVSLKQFPNKQESFQ